ncbi:hypothetical protein TNCV_3766731 [Trichonephila clavipes]|nr:hypothetical protein TNCV_3766731 [Trichonephila clavipes]
MGAVQCSGNDITVAFPAASQTCSIGERSGDLAGHGAGRHVIEDIVGRVAQYVDEHYPVDKWHLGDLIAWVAQSALKYRPRICELSKCLEGPIKMIVCQEIAPHTVTPCEIAVCRSTINAGSDRWPIFSRFFLCGGHQVRLNRDSSLKMTRLHSVTLQVPRSAKIQSTLPMMWGQW